MTARTYIVALEIVIDRGTHTPPTCWNWATWEGVKNLAHNLSSPEEGEQHSSVRLLKCQPVHSMPDGMWQTLAYDGNVVAAIKEVRTLNGCSLKEAKDIVDKYLYNEA